MDYYILRTSFTSERAAPGAGILRRLALVVVVMLAVCDPGWAQTESTHPPRTPGLQRRAAVSAAECSHGIQPLLLVAISCVESGQSDPSTGAIDPWPWSVNDERQSYFCATKAEAIKHVHVDARERPKPQQKLENQELRILCPSGGLMLISGARLHETVPNTSGVARYSIDFRTVRLDDAVARTGAPNLDSRRTGTVMRAYVRCADLQPLPEDVGQAYDDGTEVQSSQTQVFTSERGLQR